MVADHTKFGTATFVKIADFSKIDVIVTDEMADKKMIKQLENEVEFEIAKVEK